MTRYQKKPTEVVGCITKYMKGFIGLLRDHLSELNELTQN
jgi:hypothetical protein